MNLDSTFLDRYKNIINDIPQTPDNHPVVASLYSNSSTPSPRSGASSGFSSISLSPSGDCSHGVAAGKDVLHILRLNNNVKDSGSNRSRLEEIKSVRISQVRDIKFRYFYTSVLAHSYVHFISYALILYSHTQHVASPNSNANSKCYNWRSESTISSC